MVEKLVEVGYLFEFYGKLLTEKQYEVVDLYYIEDLSLQEIGDTMNVTRQGIYDLLKRAEQNLYKFEENLGLIDRYFSNNEKIKRIMYLAEDIEGNLDIDSNLKNSKEIIEITKDILKEIDS